MTLKLQLQRDTKHKHRMGMTAECIRMQLLQDAKLNFNIIKETRFF